MQRTAQFLNRFVFVALLAVIPITAIPYGTVQPWWISTFECLIFAIATVAAFEIFIRHTGRLDFSLAAPLLGLILFALFQSLLLFSGSETSVRVALSADPYSTRLFATELCALVVVMLLLLHYTSTRRRLRFLVYVIIGVGVASALFGLVRLNFQHGPGFLLPALPTGGRSFGQFINRNHFALLLEMTLGLSLGAMLGEARQPRRLLVLLPMTVLMLVAIIYSNSRGGIVAALGELLFFAVLVDPVRYLINKGPGKSSSRLANLAGGLVVRAFLILCLIGLASYGVGWIGGEPVVSNFKLAATDFTQQEMDNNTNTSRKEIWSATWQMIKANPIVGTGFGGYWIAITKYHRASGEITPQQAHNDYLELMASGGVIGCALVGWFFVVFVLRVRKRMRAVDAFYRATCLGALAGIFGVAVHSFVDFGLHIAINALILFCLVVIAARNDPSDRRLTAASVQDS